MVKEAPKIKVLLVDDEIEFLEATEPALVRRGCDVAFAEDGISALHALQEEDFAVIGTHGLKQSVPVEETMVKGRYTCLRAGYQRTVHVNSLFHQFPPFSGLVKLRKLDNIS